MVFQIAKEFLPIQVEPQRTVEIVVEAPDETTPATWFKDQVKIVHDGTKYEMATKERKRSLVVHDVKPEDAGDYVCQVGPHRTTARVEVLKPTEKGSLLMKMYRNVHVTTNMFLVPWSFSIFKRVGNKGPYYHTLTTFPANPTSKIDLFYIVSINPVAMSVKVCCLVVM